MNDIARLRYGFTSTEDALRANAERLREQLEHDPNCNNVILEALKFINDALAIIEEAGREKS